MIRITLLLSMMLMTGCSSPRPTPRPDLNGMLRQSVNSRRDPSLGGRWLASLGQRNGRERVELIDLRSRSPVPLLDHGQALSIGTDADADRLGISTVEARQRDGAAAAQVDQFDPLPPIALAQAGQPASPQGWIPPAVH